MRISDWSSVVCPSDLEGDLPVCDEPAIVFVQETVDVAAHGRKLQSLIAASGDSPERPLDMLGGFQALIADIITLHDCFGIGYPVICYVAHCIDRKCGVRGKGV